MNFPQFCLEEVEQCDNVTMGKVWKRGCSPPPRCERELPFYEFNFRVAEAYNTIHILPRWCLSFTLDLWGALLHQGTVC